MVICTNATNYIRFIFSIQYNNCNLNWYHNWWPRWWFISVVFVFVFVSNALTHLIWALYSLIYFRLGSVKCKLRIKSVILEYRKHFNANNRTKLKPLRSVYWYLEIKQKQINKLNKKTTNTKFPKLSSFQWSRQMLLSCLLHRIVETINWIVKKNI